MIEFTGPGSKFLYKIQAEYVLSSGLHVATEEGVRVYLLSVYSKCGSQAEVAKKYGVSRAIVNQAMAQMQIEKASTVDESARSLGYADFQSFLQSNSEESISGMSATLGVARSTVREAMGENKCQEKV